MTKVRFGRAVHLVREKADPSTLFRIGLEAIEPGTGRLIGEPVTDYEGSGTKFVAGDLLFGKLRPYLSKAWLADRDGAAVGDFHVYRPTDRVYPGFLRWVLLARNFLDPVVSSVFGAKMPRADWEFIRNVEIHVPSVDEQRTIADYLNRETARIDTLIKEQQRLIEMLRERRQTLVERSMLESSDAPIRLSRIASSRSGDVPPPLEEEGEYVIWGAGRIVGQTSQINAQPGDILVGRVGQGSVGKVRRLTESAWATDNTIVLRLDLSAADPRYIEHGLRLIPRFELVGGGAMPLVTAERLLAQSVPFTTLAAQKKAVIYLNQLTTKIDLLVTETERFIELSKERRSALITAAVTGQIDVREMV